MQGIYGENYKILIKVNQRPKTQRDILSSWIGKLNIVKMAVLPIWSTDSIITTKNLDDLFVDMDKLILTCIVTGKGITKDKIFWKNVKGLHCLISRSTIKIVFYKL